MLDFDVNNLTVKGMPSFESLVGSMDTPIITTPDDLNRLHSAFTEALKSRFDYEEERVEEGSIDEDEPKEEHKHKKKDVLVEGVTENVHNLFLDDELMMKLSAPEMFSDLGTVITNVHDIEWSENSVVNVYVDVNGPRLADIVFFCSGVLNLLDLIPAKKVFKLNTMCGLLGLIFARKCETTGGVISISEVGAIAISEGVGNPYIANMIKDCYDEFCEDLVKYWTERKLFTEEEAASILKTSAKVDIFLTSEEIKNRILS